MDICLLGSALSLSVTLGPACGLRHQLGGSPMGRKLSPLSISLGLSFCLLALSVLEAVPSSWLFLLDNRIIVIGSVTDDGSSRDATDSFTLSHMYFIVLALLEAYVLVVCPSMAGVMVLDRLFQLQSCNPLSCLPNEMPWWLKLVFGTISFVFKTALVACSFVLAVIQNFYGLCFRRQSPTISKRDSNSLPLTTIEAEAGARRSRISLQCLMNSVYELLLIRGGLCLVGSMLGNAVTIVSLYWLAPLIIQPKSLENWLAVGVCWITSIGIIISQIVNGFGSVSMPHSCLAGLYLEPIRPETVIKATIDLEKTKESLETRKQQLKEMRWKQVSPTATIPLGGAKRPVKKTFSNLGEEVQQQKRKILEEIVFLERLVMEMSDDVEDMKYTQQMEAASRTIVGRIKSWLGVVFSVILLIRLYFAAMAIWRHWYSDIDDVNQARKDPVTTSLLWLVGHDMVTENEYGQISQAISLLLTAILSVSQVRTFLRTVAAIHRRINTMFCGSRTSMPLTPRNDITGGMADERVAFQTRNGVYMHCLAALMGSYFLACVVLTKTMLPWQYRASFSGALGGFDAYVVQTDVITALFAMAAVASAIVLALLFGIQKSNSVRHNISWKDEPASVSSSRDLDA